MRMIKQKYVQVKKFCAPNGVDEYFLFVKADPGISFREQLKKIEQEYFDTLQMLNIDEDSVVHRKFFLSDIADQADTLKQSCLYGWGVVNGAKVAVSLVQQTPLDSCKIAMFAYHLVSPEGIHKVATSKDCLLLKRNDVSQLWLTNLTRAVSSNSISEQTKAIFEQFIKKIGHFNATLEENTIRTWLYIKDMDRDYQDMVDQRRIIFSKHGLTSKSHFIASTGISGQGRDPKTLVSMDVLSLLGVKKEQISYLKAPDNLCDTIDYGVTFERGVKISFKDRTHLHISGTTSINNFGEVINKGDVIKQTARTVENIDALLRNGNASLKDLIYIIVYLRNPSDARAVEQYLASMIDEIPYIIVHGLVCRPEWLVEIEGLAIAKNQDNNLPNF